MRLRPDRRRPGVTLIELMVAISVGGLALLAARFLIESVDDAGTSLSAFVDRTDSEANGDRLLRALFSRAEISPDSLRRFRGDTASASFDTWCESASGWMERCRVSLTIGAGVDSSTVMGILPGAFAVPLARVGGNALFRYVARDSAGVRWLDEWGQSITAPYAVLIESETDTVVLIVGERG